MSGHGFLHGEEKGAGARRPEASEPAESDFLRSSVEMDPYEGDGDEFMTARSQSFDEQAAPRGDYRTDALQPGGQDGFDIAAFRRQHGLPPPPSRAAPLLQMPAPRAPGADIDGSSSDDDSSMDDDTSSLHSLSTRTLSGGNPRYDPIAPLNQGVPAPKKRGFFQKLWSKIRGRGWR
jgi:hypothetical protein